MGLFNVLKNVGTAAYGALQERAAEVEKAKEKMEYCSESQVVHALKSSSSVTRSAASLVLQEKFGYSQEQVANIIRNR